MTRNCTRQSGLNSPLKLLLILLLLNLFLPLPAGALTFCKCRQIDEVKKEYDRAYTVFSGRVKKIKWKGGNYDRITFEVKENYKGDKKSEITVLTEHPAIIEKLLGRVVSCSYLFEEGEKYLVYSYVDKLSPAKVSSCSRTKKLDEASQDLAILNEIMSGKDMQ